MNFLLLCPQTSRGPIGVIEDLSHIMCQESSLTLKVQETKIAEFANSVALIEVAHHEPPHLDLHCVPSSL